MKELLEKMVASLQKQVEEKVPEMGNFDVVYEREDVTERHIGLILEKLKEPGLVEKLQEDLKRLIDDIDYAERHPYG